MQGARRLTLTLLYAGAGVIATWPPFAAAAPEALDVEALEMRTPLYPKAAFEAGLQGEVTLDFVISPAGRVQDVRVSAQHADSPFAGQAADALRAWRYKEVWDKSRCLPLSLPARQTFSFILQDGEPAVATQPTEFGPVPEPTGAGNPYDLPDAGTAVAVYRKEPGYPREALLKRLGGTVIVAKIIETDGRVSDVTVTYSEPAGLFDREAVRALERWRYEPVLIDGQPTRVRACQRLDFKINP